MRKDPPGQLIQKQWTIFVREISAIFTITAKQSPTCQSLLSLPVQKEKLMTAFA